jgi:hypothetical protein
MSNRRRTFHTTADTYEHHRGRKHGEDHPAQPQEQPERRFLSVCEPQGDTGSSERVGWPAQMHQNSPSPWTAQFTLHPARCRRALN